MSQITVLGFTPAQLVSSSGGANAIHWAILLSPTSSASHSPQQSPAATRPKAKSFFSSQLRFSKDDSKAAASPATALFDMHQHQLRQQEFPVPIKSSEPSEPSEPHRTTTSISSDIRNKPFSLSVRVFLSTHSLPVEKLAKKLSSLLYHTPTYGPEEDWLRAALDMLVGSGILEPAAAFDSDLVLAFVGESAKEYLSQIERGQHSEHEVLELDYAKHIREMESVRAMFSRDPPAAATAAGHPNQGITASVIPRQNSGKTSSHHYFNLHHEPKPSTAASVKTHKFLGFRVSPGPNASAQRQRWASGGENRAYYERRDDPYGGLM
ncbi:hypothetical protein PV04_00350 [Phialophora macrospora]|uniref:Uncharacterized protein n=1 Tax=Phialophora macrospora TaxID=1851006 RepID=A0A0D2G064_9EURO|nr:hypothetical protein PV04_00350 [Phialophora macrospora]